MITPQSLNFSELGTQLISLGVVVIGLIGAFFGIKHLGKKEEESEQLSKSFEQAKKASKIDENVHNMSDPVLNEQLHNVERKK